MVKGYKYKHMLPTDTSSRLSTTNFHVTFASPPSEQKHGAGAGVNPPMGQSAVEMRHLLPRIGVNSFFVILTARPTPQSSLGAGHLPHPRKQNARLHGGSIASLSGD